MAKPVLKAGRGFEFVRKGRVAVLQRRNDAGGGGADVTFSCSCHVGSGTPGKCKVVIEPDGSTIGCEKDTCGGVCKWAINIPGLTGFSVALRRRREG